jgi:putative transposase
MPKSATKEVVETKKKRVKTPSFVVELPLATHVEDERLLNDRLLCGSRLYNCLLQDGLAIVEALRNDAEWPLARKIRDLEKRREAYQILKERHHFHSVHFDKLIALHAKAAGFKGRIGSHEMQALAKRLFKSLEKWVHAKGGKPRFKGR